MVIRRSALIWGPAFLLVGLLNVVGTQPPGVSGQPAFGAAPVAGASASAPATPLRPTSSPTPSPYTRPAARLQVTVVSVKGVVQVRHSAEGPWRLCQVGMVLEQDAEFRTAPRGAVRFTVGSDKTVTVDRVGVWTLLRAIDESGRPKADDGLERGRLRYDIQDSGPVGPIAVPAQPGAEGAGMAVRG
jgi:hypothetical protein